MAVAAEKTIETSFPRLIFLHIKSLLTNNFALVNFKWLGILVIFIHLGFLGIHKFLVRQFSDGFFRLVLFGLGVGLFYLPVAGVWVYLVQGTAILALILSLLIYLADFFIILGAGFENPDDPSGNDEHDIDAYIPRFGVFVHSMILLLLLVYFQYTFLHFQDIPYLPQLLEPASKPFIAALSFLKNLF